MKKIFFLIIAMVLLSSGLAYAPLVTVTDEAPPPPPPEPEETALA